MKTPHSILVRLFVLSLLITTSITSCTQEDLLSNIIEDSISGENPDPDPDPEPDPTPVEDLVINTTPCDYSLDSLTANETLAIECQIDLEGKTVSVPAGVTLSFKGGEIINGTLNFASAGKIDGDLLNYKLAVTGAVSLVSETFSMHPSRWELVQGQTTSAIAQQNNDNLEDLMEFTKSLGATTFAIDTFDAYFEISKVTSTNSNQNWYPSVEAINIPSDFHLKMTKNTILRTYPNSRRNAGTLMAVRDVSNVTISGGTLYGERDEHEYIDTGDDGQLLFMIHGSNNIVVDGVTMTMGSAGGLNINALNFSFQPNYNPSHNITVRNCIFDNNRRMNTSITDGYDILIENNTYLNAGQDTQLSEGGNVGYAINIEAVRARNPDGSLLLYEHAHDITIRNNVERGSRVGAVVIVIGENITIEDNDFENKVNYAFTSGTKIRNNTFTATAKSAKIPAINAGGTGETVFNNEISGNKISGYNVGISVYNRDVKVYDNIIENCGAGMQLKALSDSKIYNNTITSSVKGSRGIMAHATNVNNVDIYNNEISVPTNSLYFVQLNKDDSSIDNIVNVYDNILTTSGTAIFSNAKGINFLRNESKGGIQIVNTSDIMLSKNSIDTKNSHGISLLGENYGVNLDDNTINYPITGNYECIKIASTTSKNEVSNVANNTCN